MSLMENFDLRKFMLLFDAYQHSSNQVNQRALVGIALLTFTYDSRLYIYPEIKARLELLNESKDLAENLNRIQIQLLRSRETKKIDKKMREEIIPEMIKKVNRMNRKLDIDEAEEESYSEDKNPDWNEWIEESGLNDKLKEMSELQMEGADVYMSTFSQLKTFPFFRKRICIKAFDNFSHSLKAILVNNCYKIVSLISRGSHGSFPNLPFA